MKLAIRPLTTADKPAVMRILKATPEFLPFEVTVAEELLDYFLEDAVGSGYHFLVAEAASTVVGYVCFGLTPLTEGTWYVYWIAAAPEHKGRGVGTALMAPAEAEIKKLEGRLVFVETSGKPEYENTRRFYAARGYTEICSILDFYAPGDAKLILQKRLK